MDPSKKHTIMVIDDDVDDRYLIRSALLEIDLKLDLIEFSCAEEAWRCLINKAEKTPDLIILDLNMPDVDGFEFLMRIRKHDYLNLTTCIVYSTSTDENDLVKSYKLGANSFIVKPLSYDEIREVFNNVCGYWLHTATLPAKPNRAVSSN